MNHFGLAINPVTNDLMLDASGGLAVVTKAKAVGQHARQRLMAFEGEWFLDTTAGLPWIDRLLGAAYNPALAEAVVKAELLDTSGVTAIASFSVGFERVKRNLVIQNVQVETVYDQEATV